MSWDTVLAYNFAKNLIHDTVLQHRHLQVIAQHPEPSEIRPTQGFIILILIDKLACVEPGMQVLEGVIVDLVQLHLFLLRFCKRSVERCAKVVGVKRQQVFVDSVFLSDLGWANENRDQSSCEVLAVARENLDSVERLERLMTYLEGVLLGVETAPLEGPAAFCGWTGGADMVS